MKRTLILAAAATALVLPATAETQTYDLPGFNAIDVSSGVTVVFDAGPTQSIVAESERGNFDRLIVEVENDTLVVKRTRSGWGWGRGNRDRFTVTASGPAISGLDASSGSTATANGFAGDYIEIGASSGSSVSTSGISGAEVEIDTSSGASLSASGTCTRVSIDTSSGSSVRAGDLQCESVVADASSGSSIRAYATQSVDGEASSGASISVSGGAGDVTRDRSSGGSISVN